MTKNTQHFIFRTKYKKGHNLKVQLYILGFLKRYGAQHGYALKQLLSEHASDFARIKMSNIYYHFDKMEKKGLVTVSSEKEGKRPDRMVYTITPQGEASFFKMLDKALAVPYDFESILDSSLFFYEYLDEKHLYHTLSERCRHLETAIKKMESHREETLKTIPAPIKLYVTALFDHHYIHYSAELTWVQKTMAIFSN